MRDVIIIGGGPAGLTAALYSARAGLDTVIIEKAFAGGQMATTYSVENYPGFVEGINGAELAMKMEAHARQFGAEIMNETVKQVMPEGMIKTVKTENTVYQAKTVILAMGAYPNELGFEKEKMLRGRGVSYCATCDGAFYKDKTVAVVGGGNVAAEDALFLSRFCSKVYVIHRRESLRATGVIQEQMKKNNKIEFYWNTVVEDILGESQVTGLKLSNVKTHETREISVNGVFIAIGTSPDTELVKDKIEMNSAGYIITDDNMQTNLFGVYAAGDVREKLLKQIVTAVSDGAVAAYMAEKYITEFKW